LLSARGAASPAHRYRGPLRLRRAGILNLATRLGSKKELDRISAQEIAAKPASHYGRCTATTHLAHATITSTQAVRAQSSAPSDHSMRDLILAAAGVETATAEQLRLVRLVEQVTFGVLTWAVGGELDPAQAVTDVRLAWRMRSDPSELRWRWRRDLNPRTVLAVSRFQGECIRPLCHATADKSSGNRPGVRRDRTSQWTPNPSARN
jgi:hypothetical protein